MAVQGHFCVPQGHSKAPTPQNSPSPPLDKKGPIFLSWRSPGLEGFGIDAFALVKSLKTPQYSKKETRSTYPGSFWLTFKNSISSPFLMLVLPMKWPEYWSSSPLSSLFLCSWCRGGNLAPYHVHICCLWELHISGQTYFNKPSEWCCWFWLCFYRMYQLHWLKASNSKINLYNPCFM